MSWLAEELVGLAVCWRLERRDGVTIGLTAHDRDLAIAGLTYRSAPGITPSAIVREAGLAADTTDVTGALTSEAIGEADLLAGRWDGARVVLFAADWAGDGAPVPLGEGTIGAVEVKDGVLTAELMGAAAALERPVVEATSAACRAELGDRRCRVAMAGRRRFAQVVSAAGTVVTVDATEPVAGAYAGGLVRWFGGLNAGLENAVALSDGAVLTLRVAPVGAPAAGDLIELVEGCDKRLATCAERFGNAVNFRGEPYLPGMDLLTRYPGA